MTSEIQMPRAVINLSHQLETRVQAMENYDTVRYIRGYSRNLGFPTQESFQEFLRGKTVCDLGSGFDGLAVDCILSKIDTTILSVNPRRTLPHFKDERKRILQEKFSRTTSEELDRAIATCDSNARATYAHRLPYENNSLDAILDNTAVFFYALPEESNLFQYSLVQMVNKLKPGGVIRSGGETGNGWDPKEWQEYIFRGLKLDYKIHEENGITWVEIVKPLA